MARPAVLANALMTEKAYEATPSRLARAAREGDVAISSELVGVCGFAAALGASAASVPHLASAAKAMLVAAVQQRYDVAAALSVLAWACAPALTCSLAACACAAAQSGGIRFTMPRIDLSRLSPSANLQRMFSRETLVTAGRATAAFGCAAAALLLSRGMHARSLAELAWGGAMRAAWTGAGVGIVFACVDFALQTARRKKRLRMSHDELRRDQKEHDGDPLARSRRRSAHRAMVRGSLRRVRDAAFVITNPTHIAIALEYAPPKVSIPRVLVRAAEEAALAVRAIAKRHDVPIIENVALARELFARADAGDFIPSQTYVAVAEIVAALTRAGAFA